MANKKISQLDEITIPNDDSLIAIVQNGVTSKITYSNFSASVVSNELIEIQEFLAAEPIIDRNGDSFFVVPLILNGYTIDKFDWSVFSVDTGTFTISIEQNGVSIGSTAVSASEQNATVIIPTVTLSTNDRIRIVTSLSSGATPLGLVVNLEAIKP